ncbi:uncharacterized protein LOC111089524, partial [Limulus polyphemus]|uniref:Uncharacterized protein LOC111089524 n=1 Tax=Limulus polyphemus TaxID=6850 RepID=A0ABM1TPT0_LIMPO
ICGNDESLAEDFMFFSLEQRNCLGLHITGQPLTEDDCGVCGRDGSTCYDCGGKYKGNSFQDCGVCTSERPEKVEISCTALYDEREENIAFNDRHLCAQKEFPEDPVNETDDKGAYINMLSFVFLENSCNSCVEGKMGKIPSYGLNKCDVCDSDNACIGCDGILNSGRKINACGKCLLPSDSKSNMSKAQLVSFKLNGDFTILVGKRKDKFLEKMKEQIAKILDIKPSAICNLDARSGPDLDEERPQAIPLVRPLQPPSRLEEDGRVF